MFMTSGFEMMEQLEFEKVSGKSKKRQNTKKNLLKALEVTKSTRIWGVHILEKKDLQKEEMTFFTHPSLGEFASF